MYTVGALFGGFAAHMAITPLQNILGARAGETESPAWRIARVAALVLAGGVIGAGAACIGGLAFQGSLGAWAFFGSVAGMSAAVFHFISRQEASEQNRAVVEFSVVQPEAFVQNAVLPQAVVAQFPMVQPEASVQNAVSPQPPKPSQKGESPRLQRNLRNRSAATPPARKLVFGETPVPRAGRMDLPPIEEEHRIVSPLLLRTPRVVRHPFGTPATNWSRVSSVRVRPVGTMPLLDLAAALQFNQAALSLREARLLNAGANARVEELPDEEN